MRVRELLTEDRTYDDVAVTSKKRLLDQIAQLAAASCGGLNEQEVFDALVAREKLGSTGIGEGIAIPHCRLGHCDAAIGLLLKLSEPVDFDAVDGRPVDLVFVLLVPEQNPEQHLKTLSHLANLFNDDDYRSDLRHAHGNQRLYQTAVESEAEIRLAS
ncbi:MAG: PTS IIA-like nitrogen regulatory protein PtsN [Alcanivorax sp.]|uniref:PTS IIA-like nitrogen regulatory protein PtsN n=1 Tax=Alloalcanivorax marinus TaxID=1177169 RepID=A0A9Q3UMQ4_9GAMM|nr:PTS IIA-like nitrogen regulatory protein PtsN [Alloalcanivorax marinus]MBM7332420.1 PTS IIA-like nitrogen regulatory protein PtsN [Alloalcanivorax marinus]MCC4308212.1 PTS IIA-like nitrogen regulatory protein PtsN [Alloalcanivorax marinus]MCH2557325.1 PTS IIA-like nitrogen regulatory protein PtsN [Alcanivorax sp.]MCU5787392.1 phosphotransferase system, nitrogen regulatory IIA protein [Alloalcanivorax marinus]